MMHRSGANRFADPCILVWIADNFDVYSACREAVVYAESAVKLDRNCANAWKALAISKAKLAEHVSLLNPKSQYSLAPLPTGMALTQIFFRMRSPSFSRR
jgi:hypothetical protein